MNHFRPKAKLREKHSDRQKGEAKQNLIFLIRKNLSLRVSQMPSFNKASPLIKNLRHLQEVNFSNNLRGNNLTFLGSKIL